MLDDNSEFAGATDDSFDADDTADDGDALDDFDAVSPSTAVATLAPLGEADGIAPVRLTSLTMEGFKSFAKRTAFEFEAGITGIVGPNGCGKSNLVDAFRWVLGSQSAKSLRGKEMTDVIFSGGSGGHPARFARVTLTFDNHDRYFQFDADEIDIARKLSRDGTSEYFINGAPARLRDIRELMMDTGIGVEAYSIIEQGKIAVLLETNAMERRRIFEEAAGISKFKIKRKQTLERLLRVEEKLNQLKLVLEEIQGNIRRVKTQATKAERYNEYTKDLARLRAQRSLAHYHTLLGQREGYLGEAAEAHKAEVLLTAGLEDAKKALTGLEKKARNAGLAVEQARQSRHEVEMAIAQREATLAHQEERVTELTESRARATAAIKHHETTLKSLAQRLVEAEQAVTQVEKERDALAKDHAELATRETDLKGELVDLEDSLKARRDTLFKLAAEQSAFTNEITALDGDLRHANHQIGAANRKLTELEARLAEVEATAAEQQETRTEIESELAKANRRFEGKQDKAKGFEDELANLKEVLHGRDVTLSGVRSRIDALSQFLQGHEGLPRGARALLEDDELAKRFGVVSLLAELFDVTEDSQAATIEAVLGPLAEAVVVKTEDGAYDAMTYLAEHGYGGTHLLAIDAHKQAVSGKSRLAPIDAPEHDAVEGLASDFVKPTNKTVAPLIDALLGTTVVVTDAEAARELLADLPAHAGCATGNHEVIQKPGYLRSRPEQAGLVTVRATLDRLEVERETLESELTRYREEEATLNAKHQKVVAELKKLRPKIYELTASEQETAKALAYSEHERETLVKSMDALKSEREQASADREHAEGLRKKYETELSQSRKESERAEAALDEVTREVTEAKDALTRLREDALAEARIALSEAELRHASLAERLRTLAAARDEANHQITEAKQTLEHALFAADESTKTIERCRTELDDLLERVKDHHAAEAAAAEALGEHERTIAVRRSDINDQGERLATARVRHQESQIRQQTCLEQIDELRQRVREELDVDLDELVRRYGEPRPTAATIDADGNPIENESASSSSDVPSWLPTDEDGNPLDLDTSIEKLQQKIRRLGNVNMEALDELAGLEERNTSLTDQEHDLRKMIAQLRRILDTLESASKARFQATFDGIRTNFQLLFRKLFGGGRADVFLADPEDLLGSGIEIVAKPPGKEPQTLTLLSGGERSLTALALLFAIFLTKPSPFCILDEVDAALDQANIDRFTGLLREFARRAQFLVITHAKPTMAAATRLYGVTMQEAGISKRIGINFDQFDESELGVN